MQLFVRLSSVPLDKYPSLVVSFLAEEKSSLWGGVEVPTGGKAREPFGRFGVIPKPTV